MLQNQGTILSDRQIRALCEVAVGSFKFVDRRYFDRSIEREMPIYADMLGSKLEETVMKLAEKHGGKQPGPPFIQMRDPARLEIYRKEFRPMIEPFYPHQVRERDVVLPMDGLNIYGGKEKIVSYGLSSYGYDVTCGDEFKIFTNVNSCIVDPKNFDSNSFVDVKATAEKPYIIIPPNSFALARTKEYFRIPRNVLTVCLGKSTYARCGIIVNVTPFEPEWEGYVTLEFSNTTPLPAKIYANEGCAQVLFFEGNEECDVSYKDRNGKYMGQVAEPVPPKV